ncbi:hypothetical protein PGTUg99_014619 [Puccinia graminis f. sp. tritici]|uniref:Uncharacterized protein n=1 Tax=Puccinia graminis f. sp. tritici TaxID=56615 RepID=A0A5B0SLI5_PUCGR|nr:hypothetical protein PGTUg99_014619 [Puccinia graminis f. sp. tritici]
MGNQNPIDGVRKLDPKLFTYLGHSGLNIHSYDFVNQTRDSRVVPAGNPYLTIDIGWRDPLLPVRAS